ncbi:hypothetical protein A3Q56_02349 [Intoshia linei]|uniref:Uncharacterized protein n=1 Tax=Intoshia linei TaxID=1819745 RepID=A0A177B6K2_9BILA|nr:hypothetical protein A3Q56_02349 [Intoshia linei]
MFKSIFNCNKKLYSCVLNSFRRYQLAIRREDNSEWERRAPLSPDHVKQLVSEGIKVTIQPSNRRVYTTEAYVKAGAQVKENLQDIPVIIGVKDAPVDLILPNKTYAFFSHTHKAQRSGMPLLDTMIEKNCRLIDYERMIDDTGKRLVAFGKFAGVSGMINILHGLGLRLLYLGYHTPFMYIGPTQTYSSTYSLQQAVREAGYEISLGNMPKALGPLIFVFTGSGNVSQGAMEVFENFPYEIIEPHDLKYISKHGCSNKLYCCTVSRKDHLIKKNGSPYSDTDYNSNSSSYVSNFSTHIAPYATCIINGIYWESNSPRLLTIADAKTLFINRSKDHNVSMESDLPHRLLAISDITADPGGSIEFMEECTTIDKPFCLYDAENHKDYESFKGDGVLICSIDNMPTQLPHESTNFFGSLLLPYIKEIVQSDATTAFDKFNVSNAIKGAVICSNGRLTDNYQYISDLRFKERSMRASHDDSKIKKKVAILGSGHVSDPLVEYLTRDKSNGITVVGDQLGQLEYLSDKYDNTTPLQVNALKETDKIEQIIRDHDLIVSILPYQMHPVIAKMCIKHRKNMATASYLLPKLKELHNSAVDSGIIALNEMGLDPGLDHMVAMEIIDKIKSNDGIVESYISWCGGIPSPQHCDNPLNYKFSWSPKAALISLLNGSKYMQNDKIVEIAPGDILKHSKPLDYLYSLRLQGYPNRNALPYLTDYGIETAKTILRGTIRYDGFSQTMLKLQNFGLLSTENDSLLSQTCPSLKWYQFLSTCMGMTKNASYQDVINSINAKFSDNMETVNIFKKLGILSENSVSKQGTPLDTLALHLGDLLAYKKNENDMIVMRTEVIGKYNGYKQLTTADLIVYGTDKVSAMSKTVGIPLGIGCQMILNNEIDLKGMIVPLKPNIYKTVLNRLHQENISFNIKTDNIDN